MQRIVICLAILGACQIARAQEGPALGAVLDRVAADVRAGRPIVAEVHVGLCERTILSCGGGGLGDGDDVTRNLYWATSGGLRGWLDRRGSGWTRVARDRGDGTHVLEQVVWRRSIVPDGALRARGIVRPFELYLVARAWRGRDNDLAIAAYAEDLLGAAARPSPAVPGRTLPTGGQAHLVAYVGHNRWMDRPDFRWREPDPAAPRKATIAVACYSADYLGAIVDRAGHAPVLFTHDFLFAGGHALDGALRAFASGATLGEIRSAGAQAYAAGEGKQYARVQSAFINPADRRWARAVAR
jgi:hypothetical protein